MLDQGKRPMDKTNIAVILSCAFLAGLAAQQAEADQTGERPAVNFCDPLMSQAEQMPDDDERIEELERVWRYDQETVEPVTSRAEIIEALIEEKWDAFTKKNYADAKAKAEKALAMLK